MARMIPKNHPRNGTLSNAEKQLYYWFKQHLTDEYTVIHGISFINHQPFHTEREADFIIIHPRYGILVLEVKGGNKISFDRDTDEWYINGNRKESPFEQSKKERYALRDHLRAHSKTAPFANKLRYECAVWFFDSERQKLELPNISDVRAYSETVVARKRSHC